MKTIGQRIKARREQLGISQIALAKQVGMSAPSLSLVESGKTQRPRNLDRIATVLDIALEQLEGKSKAKAAKNGMNGSAPSRKNGSTVAPAFPPKMMRLAESLAQLPPHKLKALFVLAGVR